MSNEQRANETLPCFVFSLNVEFDTTFRFKSEKQATLLVFASVC